MPTPGQKAVARVVVDLPVAGPFDYAVSPEQVPAIAVGSRVQVPFHFRKLVGCVVGLQAQSEVGTLKRILKVLDQQPVLSPALLQFTQAFAAYYGCSWGEAIAAALPASLRRSGTYPPKNKDWPVHTPSEKPQVNPPVAIRFVFDHGQTPTWRVLVPQVQSALSRREDVIILVPEAVMIPAVCRRLKQEGWAERIVLLDKQLSPGKELAAWHTARQQTGVIVVGTRSAVFAPVRQPGLYIVFEEDHPAYKQEQVPCYQARDAVLLRQQTEGGESLFLGAAPSMEVLVQAGGVGALPEIPPGQLAPLQFIDLANYKPKHRSALSFPVQTQVRSTLEHDGRVVLIYNRRGFSTLIRCNQCGHAMQCERCAVTLRYSARGRQLVCSSCQGTWPLPSTCPQCQGEYLRHLGGGVERLESDMRQFYPGVAVGRCDAGQPALAPRSRLIVATQAVVRLLDNMRPDLIVVLDMDAELNRYDFRSAVRALNFLLKLRSVGRQVVAQTYNRDHYVLRAARDLDLGRFYTEELALREDLQFPPSCHLVALMLRGPQQATVEAAARALYARLQQDCPAAVEVLDPQPDFQAKLRDQFRMSIMLKGRDLCALLRHIQAAQAATRKKKDVIVTLNVDP